MSVHVSDVVLTAGEPISGVWTLLDDEEPPNPVTPELVSCAAFQSARDGAGELRDWSAYVTAGVGTATLDAPGTATLDLGPGVWLVQIWVALDVDAVPDVFIAQINMRTYQGHPDPASELEISGVVN